MFIKVLSTQNDLYGKNNCPVIFRCELYSDESFQNGNLKLLDSNPDGISEIKMIPDEPILANGRAFLGFDMNDHKPENFEKFIPLEDGLKKIYRILESVLKTDIYIAGFGLKRYTLNILNDSFKRVLNVEPLVFPENKLIDILQYAMVKIPVENIGAYTIQSLKTYFNLDTHETDSNSAHSQLFSIRELFSKLTEIDNDVNFNSVSKSILSTTKLESFSIGKYKGRKILDVMNDDQQYCRWFISNSSKYDNAQLIAEKLKELFSREDT